MPTTTFFVDFKKSLMRIGALRWFCNVWTYGGGIMQISMKIKILKLYIYI
jgi:hypothetical protein